MAASTDTTAAAASSPGQLRAAGLRTTPQRQLVLEVLGRAPSRHMTADEVWDKLPAYKEFGFFKGTVLASWRLLRCNPWSRGGVDYARDQKVFK